MAIQPTRSYTQPNRYDIANPYSRVAKMSAQPAAPEKKTETPATSAKPMDAMARQQTRIDRLMKAQRANEALSYGLGQRGPTSSSRMMPPSLSNALALRSSQAVQPSTGKPLDTAKLAIEIGAAIPGGKSDGSTYFDPNTKKSYVMVEHATKQADNGFYEVGIAADSGVVSLGEKATGKLTAITHVPGDGDRASAVDGTTVAGRREAIQDMGRSALAHASAMSQHAHSLLR